MFTMGPDPRQAAWEQAAGNFGGGLAQSLVNYAMNQRLQKGIQGITPETPINEVISQMARAGVSPQDREFFFSPTVQTRAQNQYASQIIQDAFKNAKSPRDYVEAIARANTVTGNAAGNAQLTDLLMGAALSGGFNQHTPTGQEVPGSQGPNVMRGVSSPSYNVPTQVSQTPGSPTAPQVLQQGLEQSQPMGQQGNVLTKQIGAENPLENVPVGTAIRPFTPQEQTNIRNQLRSQYGLTLGDKEADLRINQRRQEWEVQQAEKAQLEKAQERQQQVQEGTRSYVRSKIGEDFKDSPYINEEILRAAEDMALDEKGTDNQRYQKVKRDLLTPLSESIRKVGTKLPSPSVFSGLQGSKKQAYLDSVHKDIEAAQRKVPNELKPVVKELYREQLRSKFGIGPISAEYAVSPPSKETKAMVKSLGENPEKYMKEGGFVSTKAQERQLESKRNKLTKIISKEIGKGASPLIIKDLVVNGLGYSDQFFDDAMSQALEEGLEIPPNSLQPYNDSRLKLKPDFMDIFQGNSLLRWNEFYL